MKSFQHYLQGVEFTLCTDHQPLLWLFTSKDLRGQHARWALAVQDFTFKILHRPGVTHQNADIPSRFPCSSTKDPTGAKLDPDDAPLQSRVPEVIFSTLAVAPMIACNVLAVLAGVTPLPVDIADSQQVVAHLHSLVIQQAQQQAAALQLLSDMALLSKAADDFLTNMEFMTGCDVSTLHAHDGSNASADDAINAAAFEAMQQRCAYANNIIHKASKDLQQVSSQPPQLLKFRDNANDQTGLQQAECINTDVLPKSWWKATFRKGLTVYEPFGGGLCAGLTATLQLNIPVRQYLYSDIDSLARQVAKYRCQTLSATYPHLFPHSAWQHAFDTLPMDVNQVSMADLQAAVRINTTPWLVVAGWECQDLSMAGSGLGILGRKSSSFYPLLDIVAALQSLHPAGYPVGYFLENTAFQYNQKSSIVRQQFPMVCAAIGQPVTLDATQCGSAAHRLRNYWTNLAYWQHLQCCQHYVIPQLQCVNELLEPGREPAPVHVSDTDLVQRTGVPYYAVNEVNKPRHAMPTLMATVNSYAFRAGEAGSVYDSTVKQHSEPTALERERMLGYPDFATAAPHVTDQQRCVLLGRSIDANSIGLLFHLALALQFNSATRSPAVPAVTAAVTVRQINAAIDKAVSGQQTLSFAAKIMLQQGWLPGQGLGLHARGPPTFTNPTRAHRTGLGYTQGAPQADASPLPQLSANPAVARQQLLQHFCLAGLEMGGDPAVSPASFSISTPADYCTMVTAALIAEQQDSATSSVTPSAPAAGEGKSNSTAEVWEDQALIYYLQHGKHAAETSAADKHRVNIRQKPYVWQDNQLHRIMPTAQLKIVPEPDQREQLIATAHKTSHLGVRRTTYILLQQYW
eukprot:jgi/Chrzof1/14337/UNPLg00611.t1